MKRSIRRTITIALALLALAGCAGSPDAPRAPADPAGGAAATGRADGPIVSVPAAQHFEAALDLLRRGRLEDARVAFEAMTVAYPHLAGPWLNLAIVHARSGRPDEAERALRASIERNPENAIPHNLLGLLYREQGRFDDARDAYEAALRLDPDYADAHLNYAILLDLYLQQLPRAMAHYERYRRLGGGDQALVERWMADLRQRMSQVPDGAAGAVVRQNGPRGGS